MQYPLFCGPSNRTASLISDATELINLFLERNPPGAKSEWSLLPTPGVQPFLTVPNAPGRAHLAQGGLEFAVIGTGFYEIFTNKTYLLRGTVAVNGNPGTICTNGDGGHEVFVTSGNHGYIYDTTTNAFTEVLTTGADQGGFLDGYFIAFDFTNSSFAISDLFDGLTWDPLQFTQRSVASDPWRAMLVNYTEIWPLGEFTTDVYVNTGAFPFPFEPRQGLLIPYGIAGPFCGVTVESAMIWIANTPQGSGTVVEATGYSPQAISKPSVEIALEAFLHLTDLEMWAYEEGGHEFIILSSASGDDTWAYDRSNQTWAKRREWDAAAGEWHRWRPHWHVEAWGKHLVLDNTTGTIYEMSTAFGLGPGETPIRRQRAAPALYNEGKRVFYRYFRILLEAGLGAISGQGVDPTILMEISDDGGRTWSQGRSRSMGRRGQYRMMQTWWKCGSSYDRAFRITYTDPTPLRITNAFLGIGQVASAAQAAAEAVEGQEAA